MTQFDIPLQDVLNAGVVLAQATPEQVERADVYAKFPGKEVLEPVTDFMLLMAAFMVASEVEKRDCDSFLAYTATCMTIGYHIGRKMTLEEGADEVRDPHK